MGKISVESSKQFNITTISLMKNDSKILIIYKWLLLNTIFWGTSVTSPVPPSVGNPDMGAMPCAWSTSVPCTLCEEGQVMKFRY